MKRMAFTLVELLVVIAIIGLLSTIAVAATANARAKARDAKRLSDMRQVRQALELYYDANGYYPLCSGSDVCTTTGGGFGALDIKPAFMSSIPQDPTNVTGAYGYYYSRGWHAVGSCSYVFSGLSTDYLMAMRLENPNGVSGSCPAGFAGWDNASLNFLFSGS